MIALTSARQKQTLTYPTQQSILKTIWSTLLAYVLRTAVDGEGSKLKDLKLKQATLMLAIDCGVVWLIYASMSGRSSGNPPNG